MSGDRNRMLLPTAGCERHRGAAQGFTYLGVLIMVVVFGIAFSGVSRYASTVVKREKETELFYRGDRIRSAVESYYEEGGKKMLPRRLEHLLKDNRFMGVKRHIRKIYRNPLADDGKWKIIMGPGRGIKGVYAESKLEPLKRSGFSEEYAAFENAVTYSDWKFVFTAKSSGKKKP